MIKIMVACSNRSDHAITQPMLEAFGKDKEFECYELKLKPFEHVENFQCTTSEIQRVKPDVFYASGDRKEMFAGMLAAFYERVPIVHYGSGIINKTITTFDDVLRSSFTQMADLCLCESWEAANNASMQRQQAGIDGGPQKVKIVGSLYLEGIDDIDEQIVPIEPYDLVLLNPETLKNPDGYIINDRKSIIIGANKDGDNNLFDFSKLSKPHEYYDNLPRPEFLGLLKNCQRFITNSSSAYYEAPYFLGSHQIVQVGERNKDRSTSFRAMPSGAGNAIIREIKEWWRSRE